MGKEILTGVRYSPRVTSSLPIGPSRFSGSGVGDLVAEVCAKWPVMEWRGRLGSQSFSRPVALTLSKVRSLRAFSFGSKERLALSRGGSI